jgi:hypothetical protein
LGSWVLKPYGIKLLTTNSSESFNSTMKRLVNWKKLSIDHMANSLRMIDGFYLMKIQRGRQGGRDYTLLPQLRSGIRKNAKRPQFQSTEDLFNKIKSSRLSRKVSKLLDNRLGDK